MANTTDFNQKKDLMKQSNYHTRTTTNGFKFYEPNPKLRASTKQNEGIKKITQDFKILGFRKRPHEASTRAKAYALSRAANFSSNFTNNE